MPLDLLGSSVSVCCLSPSLGCTACSLLNAWSERKRKKKRWEMVSRKEKLISASLFCLALCSVCFFVNQNGKMWLLWGRQWETGWGFWRGDHICPGKCCCHFYSSLHTPKGSKSKFAFTLWWCWSPISWEPAAIAGLWVNWRLGVKLLCWLA